MDRLLGHFKVAIGKEQDADGTAEACEETDANHEKSRRRAQLDAAIAARSQPWEEAKHIFKAARYFPLRHGSRRLSSNQRWSWPEQWDQANEKEDYHNDPEYAETSNSDGGGYTESAVASSHRQGAADHPKHTSEKNSGNRTNQK